MMRLALLVVMFPLWLGAALLEREVPENRDGIAKYEGKHYDEAGEAFKKGAERREESPEIAYNLGAALFKKGDLEGARKAWESALAKNPSAELKARIYDGLGAAAAARQNYGDAARFFEQALRAHPDRDTAANLEIVRRLLKQQEQQEQQKQQEQKEQQEQKQEEQKNEQQKNDQQNDQQQHKQEQQNAQQAQAQTQEAQKEEQKQAAQAKKEEREKKEPEDAGAVLAPFRKRKDLQVTPFMLEKQGDPQGGQIW